MWEWVLGWVWMCENEYERVCEWTCEREWVCVSVFISLGDEEYDLVERIRKIILILAFFFF